MSSSIAVKFALAALATAMFAPSSEAGPFRKRKTVTSSCSSCSQPAAFIQATPCFQPPVGYQRMPVGPVVTTLPPQVAPVVRSYQPTASFPVVVAEPAASFCPNGRCPAK